MKMTDGEKMIWAAAFVQSYIGKEGQHDREVALFCAWQAVEGARFLEGAHRGGDSESEIMLHEMMNDNG